jgi:hypothetical protein
MELILYFFYFIILRSSVPRSNKELGVTVVKVKKLKKRRHGSGRTRRKAVVQLGQTQHSAGPSKAQRVLNGALDISVLDMPLGVTAKLKLAGCSTLADLSRRNFDAVRTLVGADFAKDIEATLKARYGLRFAHKAR